MKERLLFFPLTKKKKRFFFYTYYLGKFNPFLLFKFQAWKVTCVIQPNFLFLKKKKSISFQLMQPILQLFAPQTPNVLCGGCASSFAIAQYPQDSDPG